MLTRDPPLSCVIALNRARALSAPPVAIANLCNPGCTHANTLRQILEQSSLNMGHGICVWQLAVRTTLFFWTPYSRSIRLLLRWLWGGGGTRFIKFMSSVCVCVWLRRGKPFSCPCTWLILGIQETHDRPGIGERWNNGNSCNCVGRRYVVVEKQTRESIIVDCPMMKHHFLHRNFFNWEKLNKKTKQKWIETKCVCRFNLGNFGNGGGKNVNQRRKSNF